MTREEIEARITDLEAQMKNAEMTVAAIDGAIQDCRWWLRQLEEQGAVHEEAATPDPRGQSRHEVEKHVAGGGEKDGGRDGAHAYSAAGA